MGKSTHYARQKERAVGQSHIPNSWKKSGDQKVTFCQAESAKNDTSDAAANHGGRRPVPMLDNAGNKSLLQKTSSSLNFWSPF